MTAPAPFTAAVSTLTFPPKNVDAFWVAWCKQVIPLRVPPAPFAVLCQRYHPAWLEVVNASGVVGVVADGAIVEFVPARLLFPARDASDQTGPLIQWLEGGMGRVTEPINLPPVEVAR